jgi:O-antigen/teichoic acid export membrane protein
VTLQTFRLLTVVLAFASFSLYLFVNPLVLLIYGPTFLTISNVVHLLLPGLFVNGISSVFTNFFNGSGKANFIPKIMIFPLLFQIITSLFIIPKYGLLGCSFVISFGFALNGVVTIIYFKKFTNSVLLDFIPKISDFKLLFQIIFRIIPFKF